MNLRLVTFLATMITSTVGMILFVIIIATAAIKGEGTFGDSKRWENSIDDDIILADAEEKEREEYPELYEDNYYNEGSNNGNKRKNKRRYN